VSVLSDRINDQADALTRGDRRIVSELGGAERFTVPEAVLATGFTERAVRKCLQRLLDRGLVEKLAHGSPGKPSRYRVRAVEHGSGVAS
jgi:Fic family protein